MEVSGIALTGFTAAATCAYIGIIIRTELMERRIMSAIKAAPNKVYNITHRYGPRYGEQSPSPVSLDPYQTARDSGALLCMGCGKSFPTMDGFNPIAHDCYDPSRENDEQMDLPIAYPTEWR